jgi:tight adherence protein C
MFDLFISSDAARLALLLGIFALVTFGSFSAFGAIEQRRSLKRGLEVIGRESLLRDEGLTKSAKESRRLSWTKLADFIERQGLDLADTKEDRLREKMLAAGFTSASAPRVFTLVRLILIFVLPTLYVLLTYLGQDEPPGIFTVYLVGSFLALLGLVLPNLFVQARADRRKEQVINGFPDCLDLMLVCVEAGLGIEAAMDRVGREMIHTHPLVAQLLAATTLHLRAGASREQAYRRMADLSHVTEIRSFATLLIQSDKLGTSISTTLRVYAEEMRERRRMRAEEKAHRLPVLISIPLVVFMLPTMIGVMMLPASIRMVREIFPMMTGG